MSLAENMLGLVVETATREKAKRVRRIVLEIGQLAAVDRDALCFCFEAVTRHSVAEGAALDINETPGVGQCQACGATVPLPERYAECAACGGFLVEPVSGTAMRVREIEIE